MNDARRLGAVSVVRGAPNTPAVTATAFVAVAGAISTPLVAIAGYVFNERRGRDDRAATRALADGAHHHERELAEATRQHERDLRVGERLYEDRKATYRLLLRWALNAFQKVGRTEPDITFAGMPPPPEDWPDAEYDAMWVEVSAFGSAEVLDALNTFHRKLRGFGAHVFTLRALREQRPNPLQLSESQANVRDARADVEVAFDALRTLIRDELEEL